MRYLPLIVTVGNALVFPYYIVWLKTVTLTFPMFAWMFALHSFAAALGYQLCVKRPTQAISWLYFVFAVLYIFVGLSALIPIDFMYITIIIQILLGFSQGYFRAWHVNQSFYKLHAVSNYLLVGFAMIGLSFIQIITPQFIIFLFGIIMFGCFISALTQRNKERSVQLDENIE